VQSWVIKTRSVNPFCIAILYLVERLKPPLHCHSQVPPSSVSPSGRTISDFSSSALSQWKAALQPGTKFPGGIAMRLRQGLLHTVPAPVSTCLFQLHLLARQYTVSSNSFMAL